MGRKSAGGAPVTPDPREAEIAALKRRLAAEQKRADDADRDAVELADKLDEGLEHLPRLEHLDLRDNHIRGELGLRLLCFNRGLRSLWVEGNPIDRPRALVVGVAPQVLFLDGEHLAPGALGIKERKVFESPPEPRARMAVIRDSLSPVDAASAFASAAAQRASRRSRREPNTPLSRGMSEPERGV